MPHNTLIAIVYLSLVFRKKKFKCKPKPHARHWKCMCTI